MVYECLYTLTFFAFQPAQKASTHQYTNTANVHTKGSSASMHDCMNHRDCRAAMRLMKPIRRLTCVHANTTTVQITTSIIMSRTGCLWCRIRRAGVSAGVEDVDMLERRDGERAEREEVRVTRFCSCDRTNSIIKNQTQNIAVTTAKNLTKGT